MASRTMGTVLLALFLVLTLPAYAGVYKWVDENGNVHYSEQPPEKGRHSQLHIPAAPSKPQPQSENKFVSQLRQMEADKSERERVQALKQRLETEKQIRERDKENYWEKEEQRRAEEKKARDDATVAECKRNRETYCDQGAERINSEAQMRSFEEDIAKSNARRFR